MAVNAFFHTSNVAAISTEQSLYSNLVAEAIQIHGHDVFYMDRTIVAEDSILGGDTLSKFKDAAKIEMFLLMRSLLYFYNLPQFVSVYKYIKY